jgi:hypothetical protein
VNVYLKVLISLLKGAADSVSDEFFSCVKNKKVYQTFDTIETDGEGGNYCLNGYCLTYVCY